MTPANSSMYDWMSFPFKQITAEFSAGAEISAADRVERKKKYNRAGGTSGQFVYDLGDDRRVHAAFGDERGALTMHLRQETLAVFVDEGNGA
jgi:hypothetical protein